MEIFKLMLEYLKVFIWPALIGGFFYCYRNEIKEILKNIKKLKIFGSEIEVGKVEAEKQKESRLIDEESTKKGVESLENTVPDLDKQINKYEEKLKKEKEDSQQKLDYLIKNVILKDIQLSFERIYNIIFGSQIRLLDDLSRKLNGESRDNIELYFAGVKRSDYPALNDWTLDTYLYLLKSRKLIELNQSNEYCITPGGRSFLHYISIMQYPLNKNL